MVGEPDIEWPPQLDLERHHTAEPKRRWKHADAGAVGSPVGATDVGLHDKEITLRHPEEVLNISFAAGRSAICSTSRC